MQSENTLRKIKQLSWVLRTICKIFFIPPVVIVLLTLGMMAFGGEIGVDSYQFYAHQLSIPGRVLVCIYFILRSGAMFLFVYCLHRLLGNFSLGNIFTRDSAGLVRRWGFAAVLWGVMKLLLIFMGVLSAPPNNLLGLRTGIEVYGSDLVLNGLIIVALSYFMELAAELREENELTV